MLPSFHEWLEAAEEAHGVTGVTVPALVGGGSAIPSSNSTPSPPPLPVLVIGAGPGGLCVMRELVRASLPFVCLEQGRGVGGLWDSSNPTSPCYPSLVCNSSRWSMTLDEPYAIPSSRTWASADEVLAYLQHFAAHHQLLPHCSFGCRVEQATYDSAAQRWSVRYRRLQSDEVVVGHFSDLIAASGLNSVGSALMPVEQVRQCQAAGLRCLHSAEAPRDWSSYRGQRVLVVGLSISGCDIAGEVSKVAASTLVAARTSTYFVPMQIKGIPLDRLAGGDLPDLTRLPLWLSSILLFLAAYLLRGIELLLAREGDQLGLQRPSHSVLDKLPIEDDEFKRAVKAGRVQLRPEVRAFSPGRVEYVHSNRAVLSNAVGDDVDVVIFATGYSFRHPYLPEQLRPTSAAPSAIHTGRQPSLAAPKPLCKTSNLALLLFSPLNPHLYFIPETTAGFAWAVFPHQAKALVALLWARRAGVGRAARFDRVLSYPNPPLCGPMLGGEYWKDTDEFTVERSLYLGLLGQFLQWLEGDRGEQSKKLD